MFGSGSSPLTEATILAALKAVRDPDSGRDIVDLGMIQGIAIADNRVSFAIAINPARAKHYEKLRAEAESLIRALSGVKSVSAVLTAERQAAPAASGTAGRTQIAPPGVRFIVAVASGKGGVGKSTTATNIACALAASGLRTGLLDADIYGPSQPRLLGISSKPTSADGKIMDPMRKHGIAAMSIGFLLDEEKPVIWRGPMVMSALQQMLRDVAWGELDILIVDMPPGTGDAQLTMAQSVGLAGAIIVSTPQDIALLDARKGLNMFRKVEVPILGVIENMSYFSCPHCGERTDIFSHGGAAQEAARMDAEFLGEIPLDIAIRETSDAGTPIVLAQPSSPHALAYAAIAARIWAKLNGAGSAKSQPKIVIE